jgi:MoaA/NifB/PqqE/SkfB family radical SAM enzyme
MLHTNVDRLQPSASSQPLFAIHASNLLILLLFNRCNNRCRFCMVNDHIGTGAELPLQEGQRLITEEPATTRVEFFGGEPTLYPHFISLLSLARQLGHSCSIATNGRAFASVQYTRRIASLGASQIYVRTSLYGPTARIHDYFTRSSRSFDQTIHAIENLAKHSFPTQVNIVLMRMNFQFMEDMVNLVAESGTSRIKFSMLTDSKRNLDHVVSISELRPSLRAAIELAIRKGLSVTIEKAPMCIAPEFVSHFACERKIVPTDRVFDHSGACARCIAAPWCPGLDPGYMEVFGGAELIPLKSFHKDQVLQLGIESLSRWRPEILKVSFIAYDRGWLHDIEALQIIAALKARCASGLSELALVPNELIQ